MKASMPRQQESRRVNANDEQLQQLKAKKEEAKSDLITLLKSFAAAFADDIKDLPKEELEYLSEQLTQEELSPLCDHLVRLMKFKFSVDEVSRLTDEYMISHKAYSALYSLLISTFHDVGLQSPLPSAEELTTYKQRLDSQMLDLNPQPTKRVGVKVDFKKVSEFMISSLMNFSHHTYVSFDRS